MKSLQYISVVLTALALPVNVSAQIQDCDRLAASPLDPQKQTPGLSYNQLNANLAVPACKKATEESPQTARLWFQYGRALEKGNRLPDAIYAYQEAAKLKSGAAHNNLGELYRDGKGFQKDLIKAEEYFALAASLNSPEGKSNLSALQAQQKKVGSATIPKELLGSWAGKGSVCLKILDKKSLSKWYGMVFTNNELKKGRVSDYEIGPDLCTPQKVTGQFPSYAIAFDCKPGDDGPYTTIEKFMIVGDQLSIDLNGITVWTRCPN